MLADFEHDLAKDLGCKAIKLDGWWGGWMVVTGGRPPVCMWPIICEGLGVILL